MGRSLDIYCYETGKLIEAIEDFTGGKRERIKEILDAFGDYVGDYYILVCNEFWEEYNSFFGIGDVIDSEFDCKDSYEIFSTYKPPYDIGARGLKHSSCKREVCDDLDIELIKED